MVFPQVDTILQIIKKHTNESIFQKLSQEIDTHMVQPGLEKGNEEAVCKPELRELLTAADIRVINECMGWKEAIEFAAIPLLYKNVTRYQYVETIISNIINCRQIMLVADQVMFAHAGIDDGVYDLGLSLLLLPESVMTGNCLPREIW